MRLIGITQRIDFIEDYNEQRDALDKKWSEFLSECELVPIILPNNEEIVEQIIENVKLDGFIFTGGGNLSRYGGNTERRDKVELFCIKYAINNKLPVIGICRGMQFIQDYFGVELKLISNHIGVYHNILNYKNIVNVNSYHSLGTTKTVKELKVIAYSEDNIVEAIKHMDYNIYGIMWHPERVTPFSKLDKGFFKGVFHNKSNERGDRCESYNFSCR